MVREISQLCMASGTTNHVDPATPRRGFGTSFRSHMSGHTQPPGGEGGVGRAAEPGLEWTQLTDAHLDVTTIRPTGGAHTYAAGPIGDGGRWVVVGDPYAQGPNRGTVSGARRAGNHATLHDPPLWDPWRMRSGP